MKQKRFLSMFALLLAAVVTGAWADDTYTVQFKANGNTKTVENVVLPHQFRCDFSSENGELDQIIKELYGLSGGYCNGDLHSSGNENVTCGSSDMDDYITISAPFEGTATVTGWYYSSTLIQYSLEISIPSYVAPTVNVTGVSLSETTASMTVGGDALTLTATVAPDDATDKTVTWTTSDAAVATVADGVVTAVAAGTATITATATNGTADTSDDKTATCTVTVAEPTYTVTVKEGTEDAANWSVSPNPAEAGQTVTINYAGTKKVKSVKAVKKEVDPAPASGTDFATITADYEAKDGETLTGTLASNVKISIADGAKVTLKDVTINGVNNPDYGWAGITCAGDATITLEGANTLKGFNQEYPGIYVPEGKTITIEGEGSLNASGNGRSTGIGGGYYKNCGDIVINGGNITATGGSYNAGIGGGESGDCGAITINGGTVTATGGGYAAGIGGGNDANCGNITISGGNVTATGGQFAAGIGGGKRGFGTSICGNITISGGTITATGGENAAGIGGGKGRNNSNPSSCGTITITSGVTSVTATKGSSAENSIGAGSFGTCGAVTIEDPSKVTQN